MRIAISGFAGLVLLCTASTASAADFVPVVVPVPVVTATPPAPGFGWSGPYAGPILGLYDPFGDGALIAGAAVGFNIVRGPLVAGIEGQGAYFHYIGGGGDYFFGLVRARAGVTLGATDRILLYTAVGAGVYAPSSGRYVTGAAGMELGIGDRISIRSEATAFYYFPDFAAQWTTGVFWHFGR